MFIREAPGANFALCLLFCPGARLNKPAFSKKNKQFSGLLLTFASRKFSIDLYGTIQKGTPNAMHYEIIRQPFMFIETITLLYRYVNGLSFSSLWNHNHEPRNSPRENDIRERLLLLQRIMDEVCEGMDREDTKLQYFFASHESTPSVESSCLARYLVSAFLEYKNPGFEQTIADILESRERMHAQGGWLKQSKGIGLEWTTAPDCPGDLFAQICALTNLSAEFRLQLYGALHQFPETLQELADLMRPVSLRLEDAFSRSGLCLGDMAEYWLHSQMPPIEFLADTLGQRAVEYAGDCTRLAIGLMNANMIYHGMANDPYHPRPYNYMYIGCCISSYSLVAKNDDALDKASTVLRGPSERKRLEVLRRLSKRSCYGLELAEIMSMDRGNLSRLLSVLHSQGFLIQEKENQRVYYRANREALQKFFDQLMSDIFD